MKQRQFDLLPPFTKSYIICALWCSSDDEETPLDTNYGPEDISVESSEIMIRDCNKFMDDNKELMRGLNLSQCGHDFWLTRNGHGCGFWDRGLGEIGNQLAENCEVFGTCDLYAENNEVGVM